VRRLRPQSNQREFSHQVSATIALIGLHVADAFPDTVTFSLCYGRQDRACVYLLIWAGKSICLVLVERGFLYEVGTIGH
jgi:hypothetical protein